MFIVNNMKMLHERHLARPEAITRKQWQQVMSGTHQWPLATASQVQLGAAWRVFAALEVVWHYSMATWS